MNPTRVRVAALLLLAFGCSYDWGALDPRLGDHAAAGSSAAGAPASGGATAAAGEVVAGGGGLSTSGSAGQPSGGTAGTAGAAPGPTGGGAAGQDAGGSGGGPAGAGGWAGSEVGSGGGPAGAGGWAGSEVGSGGSAGEAGHSGASGNQGAAGSVAGGAGGIAGGASGGSAGAAGTAGAAARAGAAGTEEIGGAAGAGGSCAGPCGRYEVCLDGVCALPCSGVGLEALFVVGNETLTAADAAVSDWLQTTLGFTLTILAADAATTADADGRALVVVSSTVGSGAVATKFTTVSTGVITWEANVYDDLLLTGPTSGTDYGSGASAASIEIVNPTSSLAVGLSGTTAVLNAAAAMAWGVPVSSAAIIARPSGSSTQATVFAFETGATLYDASSAAGRRMGTFLGDTTATELTEDGERLILAAFCWTAGLYP
jgi:hypothetical protein